MTANKPVANPRWVGRVTPCAPRLQPPCPWFFRRYLPILLSQMTFPEFFHPQSAFRVQHSTPNIEGAPFVQC